MIDIDLHMTDTNLGRGADTTSVANAEIAAAKTTGQLKRWVRRGLTGLGLASALSITACADAKKPVKYAEAKIEKVDTSVPTTDDFDLDAFLETDLETGAADVARAKQETAREKQETAQATDNLAREKQETAAAREIRQAAEKAEDPAKVEIAGLRADVLASIPKEARIYVNADTGEFSVEQCMEESSPDNCFAWGGEHGVATENQRQATLDSSITAENQRQTQLLTDATDRLREARTKK